MAGRDTRRIGVIKSNSLDFEDRTKDLSTIIEPLLMLFIGSVVGAIVGEFFFKSGAIGIGSRIQLYTANGATDRLIAAILLTAVLGIIIFLFFGWLSSRVTRSWRADAASART